MTMAGTRLSVDSLPVWASLNDVHLSDVKIGALGEKGQGIVSTGSVAVNDGLAEDSPALVRVPHDIVLCEDVIEGYAKGDRRLKEIFDAMGPQVDSPSPPSK